MPKTVLLADDSVTIQKVVGISLANEDVELITVDNGDEAVEKAKEIRPDLILADVVMPGKNGYEVAKAIKADPNLRHIPVLLLTQTFESFDETQASAAGADGHITKPFEAQTLVERVNTILAAQPPAPPPVAVEPPPVPEAPAMQAEDLNPNRSGEQAPSEDGFDFLAEGGLSRSGVPAAETVSEGTSGFDMEAEGGAFDFATEADEDGAARTQVVMPDVSESESSSPDQTIAMMPDELPDPLPATDLPTDPPADRPAEPGMMNPAETVAILPDEPAGAPQAVSLDAELGDMGLGVLDEEMPAGEPSPAEPAFDLDMGSPDPAPETNIADPSATVVVAEGSDAFDFAFDAPPAASEPPPPAEPENVPDIGMDFSANTETEPSFEPPPLPPAEALADAVEVEPIMEQPIEEAPIMEAEEPVEEFPVQEAPPMEPEPVEMAPIMEAVEEAPVMEPEPIEAAPVFEPVEAAPIEAAPVFEPVEAAPIAIEPEPMDPAPAAAPSLESSAPISAEMREEIHKTIEKVAWDAMGDLSESIIKQVVASVEAIAWEVIPQMAETLIQEEIQRMKKGS